MNLRIAVLTGMLTLLASLAGAAQTGKGPCNAPAMPAMPDGAKASMQKMLDGQKSVKSFQSANVKYMQCLESNFSAAKANASEAGNAAKAEYDRSLDAYNAAVSAEEEVAGQFNIELREYKAANR
ncbi:MAG: hypothetical protein ACI87W_000843 [Halieaceae bacterium]|jgi:hypothetical protein